MQKSFFLLLSTSLLLSLFCFPLIAQQNNSIFYLKNGSIYIGEVLDDKTDNLQIRLIDDNEVQISATAVKRYLAAKHIQVFSDGRYNPTNGFFFNMGLGFNGEGLADDEDTRVSSHNPYLFGWHLNSRWSAAAGFGFEFNEARIGGFTVESQVTSLFLYGRYYLTEQKRRPFLYARVGTAAAIEEDEIGNQNKGGFQFQAGGGFQFASRKNSRWMLSLGYHLQEASGQQRFIDFTGGEVVVDYDLWIQRIIFGVAVEFNRRPRGYRRR